MTSIIKLLGSEATCNTTPNNYSSSRLVRLVNKGTTVFTITQKIQPQPIDVSVNASANGTTLITLATGDTSNLAVGLALYDSSNLGVINTDTAAVIASIVNTTAFATNVDILVATGVCTIYAVDGVRTCSILPNTELLIEKASRDWLQSSNNAQVILNPVAVRG